MSKTLLCFFLLLSLSLTHWPNSVDTWTVQATICYIVTCFFTQFRNKPTFHLSCIPHLRTYHITQTPNLIASHMLSRKSWQLRFCNVLRIPTASWSRSPSWITSCPVTTTSGWSVGFSPIIRQRSMRRPCLRLWIAWCSTSVPRSSHHYLQVLPAFAHGHAKMCFPTWLAAG